MAFKHGRNVTFYIDGRRMTRYFREVDVAMTVELAESTRFGDSADEHVVGHKQAVVTAGGLFDHAASDTTLPDNLLDARHATNDKPWTVYFHGESAVGDPGYGVSVAHEQYDVSAPVKDIVAISAVGRSNVGAERLICLHPYGAETATGNGTAHDNTASTANGGASYLHVTAFSGTTATVKVQHSSDNVTYADLITHTAVTAAPANGERSTASGTVNRYTRYNLSGTFTTITFSLGFGRK